MSKIDSSDIISKTVHNEEKNEIIELSPIVPYENTQDKEVISEEEINAAAKSGMFNYTKFKENFDLIVFGNDVKFVHKYNDDKGDESFVVKKKSATRDEWADRKAFIQIESLNNAFEYVSVDVTVLAIEGVTHPDATLFSREYGKAMKRWQGISFSPGVFTDVAYNRYRGFPIEPERGDITPLLEFLEKAFGKEGLEVILIFFASMYQHPEIKLRWMLSLIGEKGLGKNTVEELLGHNLLYGENYVRMSNTEHLFGKFNAAIETNLLTVAQEIIWDGDKQHDSILKEWITETTRTIERKYVDSYTVANCSRILMTSNADWVVPASGKEERRYAVLRIKNIGHTPNDWGQLYQWAEEHKSEIMYYLLNYPLKDNYHSKAPYTIELTSQLRQGLTGVESYIFDGIANGYFGKRDKFQKDIGEIYVSKTGIPAKIMYNSYIQTRDTHEKLAVSEFGKKLAGTIGSGKRLLGFQSKRVGKQKQTTYILTARQECAKIFYLATGVEIPLSDYDKEWKPCHEVHDGDR